MKIGIIAPGMRGDVEPHLALALELQTRGHAVTVASHATFAPVCHELGIPFRLLDKTDVRQHRAGHHARRPQENALRWARLLWRNAPDAPDLGDFRDLDSTVELCRESDLIVCGPGPVSHVCEKQGRACVLSRITPYEVTRAYPLPIAPLGLQLFPLPVGQPTHAHSCYRQREKLQAERSDG